MKLEKHILDFEKTYPFFIDYVDWNTHLSRSIMKNIDFKKGVFLTYLPECANFEQLYEFSRAGMLPQFEPPERLPQFPNCICYPVSNIDEEISEYILNYLEKNPNNMAFFEFYNLTPKSPLLNWEDKNLLQMVEEIYYMLKRGANLEMIKKARHRAESIKHCIIVLMDKTFDFPRNLRKEDFDLVSQNAFQIITTAYDGEGYVFWEKRT